MSIDFYHGCANVYRAVLELKTGVNVENLLVGTAVYLKGECFLKVGGNPKECKLLALFCEMIG